MRPDPTHRRAPGLVLLLIGTTWLLVAAGGLERPSVVALAGAYLDLLTPEQRAATLTEPTAANAARWSNLPSNPVRGQGAELRNGVAFSTLSAEQQAAWLALVGAALGERGFERLRGVRAADDFLGGETGRYDGDWFYVAFVGTPSTTDGWLLQIGGHHLAVNQYYVGDELRASSPYYLGINPDRFELDGEAYAPLDAQREAMRRLLGSLSEEQLAAARLDGRFGDVVLGPGRDARTNFPTGETGRGLLVASLSDEQRALVGEALAAWTADHLDGTTYDTLYARQLPETYLAWSGTTSLDRAGDYVRLDGPRVWLELACQSNLNERGQRHLHTIWRDRVNDYAAAFGF